MPVSHDFQFVFVHVPKCAGSSISQAFKQANVRLDYDRRTPRGQEYRFGDRKLWLNHLTAPQLMNEIGEERWKRYFKFTFTRNPWDRMVSHYFYFKSRVKDGDFGRDWPAIVGSFVGDPPFDEWIMRGIPAAETVSYISDGSTPEMDFVGRFERLATDFQQVCDRVGVRTVMPHCKRTDHVGYRTYYTPRSRLAVSDHFANDIRAFGYRF